MQIFTLLKYSVKFVYWGICPKQGGQHKELLHAIIIENRRQWPTCIELGFLFGFLNRLDCLDNESSQCFFSGITCKTPHDMIWLQVTRQNFVFCILHCIGSKSSVRFVLCCCCYKYLPDVYDFDILWGKVTYMYSCIHLSSEK